jgi:UDP-glucose 4-epimerase
MPRVLLTGSSGLVGRPARSALTAAGFQVRPFDLADGQDLRDPGAVLDAAAGCDAVVHAGALAHDTAGSAADIVATNVQGTWHVLLAAEARRLSRVVYFSSAQVFGIAEGEGTPEYLPVDDDHPVRAARPYGMSKRLAEEMCQAWTTRTGIPTVVLRPVMILTDDSLAAHSAETAEFGAFVHVDDVADAVVRALSVDLHGHHRLTLCGPGAFDTARAETTLGWRAARGWPGGR